MGVRGLKTFMEREQQVRTIDIAAEVNKWKSRNPDQIPIIVIDFLSLVNCASKKYDEVICGGRHQIALNTWTNILNTFEATGAKLVFFSDLNIQESKIEEWMNRRNEEFQIYTDMYNKIESGQTLQEIRDEATYTKALTSTFYGMAMIAENFGEFNYSIRHECDLELAQYATRHNAIAVITNDTDFLIFEGRWRFWSSQEIQFNPLTTAEYNRHGLANICSLAPYQLPLLATLIGNDLTKKYSNTLIKFASALGPLKYRIKCVARFVRKEGTSRLSDEDIKRIVQRVFLFTDDKIVDVVKQSISSYSLNFSPITVTDPIGKKLLHTKMYRPYMANMFSIHGLTMGFYDMRGCEPAKSLPSLLIDWLKGRKGILWNSKRDNNNFILLAKRCINIDYIDTTEIPFYPEFQLPPLERLYLNTTDDVDLRWNIFGWIMSYSNEVITMIKKLPNDFLVICVSLYSLVESKLISKDEADGILYSENKVLANETGNVGFPIIAIAKNIRAAHLYNIVFSHVRQNFAIAGFNSLNQQYLQFDGVYFQMLMEKLCQMNVGERDIFMTPIKKYRIYSEL